MCLENLASWSSYKSVSNGLTVAGKLEYGCLRPLFNFAFFQVVRRPDPLALFRPEPEARMIPKNLARQGSCHLRLEGRGPS